MNPLSLFGPQGAIGGAIGNALGFSQSGPQYPNATITPQQLGDQNAYIGDFPSPNVAQPAGFTGPIGNQVPYGTYQNPGSSTPTPAPTPAPSNNNGGGGSNYASWLSSHGYNDPNVINALASNPPDWLRNAVNPQADPYAGIRSQISSGWDSFNNQLNDVLNNGLPAQQGAQNNIINDQYNQGVNTVNSQKASSLKDIANNIKNAFQAGNIYLGARGAGDSSAANQYSFALNQEGAKQNSDLGQFVNTQLQNLSSQRDQGLNQVANWYASAQNQLKQALANGAVSKSQDLSNLSSQILNQGLAQLNQIQQNSQAQYNALLGWAANNSKSLGDLQTNIAGIPKALGPIQMGGGSNGTQAPVGYGYSDNTNQNQNSIFNDPSWFQ